MAALSENQYRGDWLKDEFCPPNYCRETGTLVAGQNLKSGTVLCTNAGKYQAFDDGGGGTLGTATGILLDTVNAVADTKVVVLVRGPAVVSKAGLTWDASNDATEILAGLVDLKALGIIAREGV